MRTLRALGTDPWPLLPRPSPSVEAHGSGRLVHLPAASRCTVFPLSLETEEELSSQVSRAIGPQGTWVEGSEEPQRFASKSGKLLCPVARPAGPPPEAHWRRLASAFFPQGSRGSHGKVESGSQGLVLRAANSAKQGWLCEEAAEGRGCVLFWIWGRTESHTRDTRP